MTPDAILPVERWPVMPTAAEQIADARARRLPRIALTFPRLARSIDAFYERCERDVAARHVILHGDLIDDHILLARDGGGLSGIIRSSFVTNVAFVQVPRSP